MAATTRARGCNEWWLCLASQFTPQETNIIMIYRYPIPSTRCVCVRAYAHISGWWRTIGHDISDEARSSGNKISGTHIDRYHVALGSLCKSSSPFPEVVSIEPDIGITQGRKVRAVWAELLYYHCCRIVRPWFVAGWGMYYYYGCCYLLYVVVVVVVWWSWRGRKRQLVEITEENSFWEIEYENIIL